MKNANALLLFIGLFSIAPAQISASLPGARNKIYQEDTTLIEPSFPGGEKAFSRFLSANLKRPNQLDVFGKVFISFFVEIDGSLSDFKVEKTLGKDYDREALRVLRKSPKWIPARRNGKATRIKYIVPINFTITK